MRAYLIGPKFAIYSAGADDPRSQSSIELVTDMVFQSLRAGGDDFQFAFDWLDPGTSPGSGFHEDIAEPHLSWLKTDDELRNRIRASVDPWSGFGGNLIRSAATCRGVTFGYDGQALLCLRHEDSVPCSPNSSLVDVTERPDFLYEYDYFDGWIRDEELSSLSENPATAE